MATARPFRASSETRAPALRSTMASPGSRPEEAQRVDALKSMHVTMARPRRGLRESVVGVNDATWRAVRVEKVAEHDP